MPSRFLRLYLAFALLAALLLLSATGTPPAEAPRVRIVVFADGEIHSFISGESTAAGLLEQAGVELGAGDMLIINGLAIEAETGLAGSDPIVLQVQRALTATIEGVSIKTTALTVADALWDENIRLRFSDEVIPAAQVVVKEGMAIDRTPGRLVRVQVGERTVTTRTAAETVGEALQDAGLALQGLDYSVPDTDVPLPQDGIIRLVRVQEEVLLEQVSLPFETLTQPVEDLELDQTQVVQVGQFGLQASRVRVRYDDGQEVSRVTEARWIAVEPKPRILGYGTKIVVRTIDTPGGPVEYWRAVPAFATSYSPCRLGIDTCGNTTASGLKLEKGVVGVIRSWYNAMVFSQVYVPGYGVGVIADIGAGVSGQNWIDLGYSDGNWKSWAANVTIYFLTPVPPPDQILWILP